MKHSRKVLGGVSVLMGVLLAAGCGNLLLPAAVTPESPPTLAQKVRGIWMVGGVSNGTVGSAIAQVDLFDPETSTWHPAVTSLPTPVSFGAAAGYARPSDGHHLIVVIGGFDAVGVTQSIVQIYDVENGAWSSGTSMSASRANMYATLVNDKIYILGGSGSAAATNATTPWAGNNTTWEYTIGSTWFAKVAFGAAGTERFSYAYDNVVYHLIGRTAAATYVATHDGVSISANLLTTGLTEVVFPSARAGVAGALWRKSATPSYLMLVGGYTAMTGSSMYFVPNGVTASTPTNSVYVLAYPFTAPSTWSLQTFPQTIGFGAAVVYGDTFYHFGGTTTVVPASASGEVTVRYADLNALPGSVTWYSASPMPVGRFGHSAVMFPQ